MTTAVHLTAVLREPASFGIRSRADFRQATLDHVPGSVLRGALARVWLRSGSAVDQQTFRAVFEGTGTFGPLHTEDSVPIPLSVRVHKNQPEPSCRSWWWDEIHDQPPVGDACPDCAGPLEPSKGQPIGTVATIARTRVAIGANGIAVDGALFRRSALAAGTTLSGWISGPAVDALRLGGTPITTVRLGGERSVRGLAELSVHAGATLPMPETDGNDVILRLAAPGIFLDRYGLPADKPAKSELTAALGVRIIAIELCPPVPRWTEVGGWHMASGLPKPTERAVAPGTTYRIRCATHPAPAPLAELMVRGIGARRTEGFGALYRDPTRPRDLVRTAAPLTAWPAWSRLQPLLHEHIGRLRAGRSPASELTMVTLDASLTPTRRRALEPLLAITDPDLLAAVLNGLTA